MLSNIKTDLKKAFSNSRLYVSIFGLAFVLILNILPMLQFTDHPTLEGMLGESNSSGMVLYFFIFCIAGGGFFFCTETKSGNLRYLIGRSSVRSYTRSKMCISFLCGFLTIFVGVLLEIAAYMGILALYNHSFQGMVWDWPGLQEELLYCLSLCILGGLLSSIAFLVTTIIPNYFIAIIVPIMVHYLLLNITGDFPLQMNYSIIFIYKIALWNSLPLHFAYEFFIAALLCWLMEQVCIKRIERRLEHA